jgi:hypothetical protein
VLTDRRRLVLSVGYVVGGAAAVVAIGLLLGLAVKPARAFATNGQVEAKARIAPGWSTWWLRGRPGWAC